MYHPRDFYRHVDVIHGFLSAFAFVLLCFFALTGLLLNNPHWFNTTPDQQAQRITLPSAVAQELITQENPSNDLLDYLKQNTNLIGRYQRTEVIHQQVRITLASPAGSTDILAQLDTGIVQISHRSSSTLSLIKNLHQAHHAGEAWRWFVNVTAILILLLCIAGYMLSLSLNTQRIKYLSITALSLMVLIVCIWLAV